MKISVPIESKILLVNPTVSRQKLELGCPCDFLDTIQRNLYCDSSDIGSDGCSFRQYFVCKGETSIATIAVQTLRFPIILHTVPDSFTSGEKILEANNFQAHQAQRMPCNCDWVISWSYFTGSTICNQLFPAIVIRTWQEKWVRASKRWSGPRSYGLVPKCISFLLHFTYTVNDGYKLSILLTLLQSQASCNPRGAWHVMVANGKIWDRSNFK